MGPYRTFGGVLLGAFRVVGEGGGPRMGPYRDFWGRPIRDIWGHCGGGGDSNMGPYRIWDQPY